MKPVIVVNLRKTKYDVYIGRAGRGHDGRFGNPFVVDVHGGQGECVVLFKEWFHSNDPEAVEMRKRVVDEIRPGTRLGCFCKPNRCHGDIIAEYVNNEGVQ